MAPPIFRRLSRRDKTPTSTPPQAPHQGITTVRDENARSSPAPARIARIKVRQRSPSPSPHHHQQDKRRNSNSSAHASTPPKFRKKKKSIETNGGGGSGGKKSVSQPKHPHEDEPEEPEEYEDRIFYSHTGDSTDVLTLSSSGLTSTTNSNAYPHPYANQSPTNQASESSNTNILQSTGKKVKKILGVMRPSSQQQQQQQVMEDSQNQNTPMKTSNEHHRNSNSNIDGYHNNSNNFLEEGFNYEQQQQQQGRTNVKSKGLSSFNCKSRRPNVVLTPTDTNPNGGGTQRMPPLYSYSGLASVASKSNYSGENPNNGMGMGENDGIGSGSLASVSNYNEDEESSYHNSQYGNGNQLGFDEDGNILIFSTNGDNEEEGVEVRRGGGAASVSGGSIASKKIRYDRVLGELKVELGLGGGVDKNGTGRTTDDLDPNGITTGRNLKNGGGMLRPPSTYSVDDPELTSILDQNRECRDDREDVRFLRQANNLNGNSMKDVENEELRMDVDTTESSQFQISGTINRNEISGLNNSKDGNVTKSTENFTQDCGGRNSTNSVSDTSSSTNSSEEVQNLQRTIERAAPVSSTVPLSAPSPYSIASSSALELEAIYSHVNEGGERDPRHHNQQQQEQQDEDPQDETQIDGRSNFPKSSTAVGNKNSNSNSTNGTGIVENPIAGSSSERTSGSVTPIALNARDSTTRHSISNTNSVPTTPSSQNSNDELSGLFGLHLQISRSGTSSPSTTVVHANTTPSSFTGITTRLDSVPGSFEINEQTDLTSSYEKNNKNSSKSSNSGSSSNNRTNYNSEESEVLNRINDSALASSLSSVPIPVPQDSSTTTPQENKLEVNGEEEEEHYPSSPCPPAPYSPAADEEGTVSASATTAPIENRFRNDAVIEGVLKRLQDQIHHPEIESRNDNDIDASRGSKGGNEEQRDGETSGDSRDFSNLNLINTSGAVQRLKLLLKERSDSSSSSSLEVEERREIEETFEDSRGDNSEERDLAEEEIDSDLQNKDEAAVTATTPVKKKSKKKKNKSKKKEEEVSNNNNRSSRQPPPSIGIILAAATTPTKIPIRDNSPNKQQPHHLEENSESESEEEEEEDNMTGSSKVKSMKKFFHPKSSSSSSPSQNSEQPQSSPTSSTDRRRNFAFIRQGSTNRKKMSASTLERTREHAKQLALAAGSPINTPKPPQPQTGNTNNSKPIYSMADDLTSVGTNQNANSKNNSNPNMLSSHFRKEEMRSKAMFDTSSVISNSSSAYDMDALIIPQHANISVGDDSSVFSGISGLSSPTSMLSSALPNNTRSRKRHDHFMESSNRDGIGMDAFHPLNMKRQLAAAGASHGSDVNAGSASGAPSQTKSNSRNASRQAASNAGDGSSAAGSTFPSNSSMRGSNHVTGSTVSHSSGGGFSGAAARRLLRRSRGSSGFPSSGGSVVSEGGDSEYSVLNEFEDGVEQGMQRDGGHQVGRLSNGGTRRPPLSPFPGMQQPSSHINAGQNPAQRTKTENQNSHSNSGSNNNQNWDGVEQGFSFDAFGLDANEIDNEVNVALAELAGTHPDFDFFLDDAATDGGSQQHLPQQQRQQQHSSVKSNSSPSTAPTAPLTASTSSSSFPRGGGGGEGTATGGREPESQVVAVERESSDSSSLTTSSIDPNAINHTQRNMFKEPQNGSLFHKAKKVIRPDYQEQQQQQPHNKQPLEKESNDFPMLSSSAARSTFSSQPSNSSGPSTSLGRKLAARHSEPQSGGSGSGGGRSVSSIRDRFESSSLPDISLDDCEEGGKPSTDLKAAREGLRKLKMYSALESPNPGVEYNSNDEDGQGTPVSIRSREKSNNSDAGFTSEVDSDVGVASNAGQGSKTGVLPPGFLDGKELECKKKNLKRDATPPTPNRKGKLEWFKKEVDGEEILRTPDGSIVRKSIEASKEEVSMSQKRAREWAAARTSPIVLSPLLNPESYKQQESVSISASQKRAKEWAEEAPVSPCPRLVIPDVKETESSISLSQIRAKSWAEEAPDSPKVCLVKKQQMNDSNGGPIAGEGEPHPPITAKRLKPRSFRPSSASDVGPRRESTSEISAVFSRMEKKRIERRESSNGDEHASVVSMSSRTPLNMPDEGLGEIGGESRIEGRMHATSTPLPQKSNAPYLSSPPATPPKQTPISSVERKTPRNSYWTPPSPYRSPQQTNHGKEEENEEARQLNLNGLKPHSLLPPAKSSKGTSPMQSSRKKAEFPSQNILRSESPLSDGGGSDPERFRTSAPSIPLRKSGSPISDGGTDPERFKATVPSVPLRKAPRPPPRDYASDSEDKPNFLSNIKLRKIPRKPSSVDSQSIENLSVDDPAFSDPNSHYDSECENDEPDMYYHQYQGHYDPPEQNISQKDEPVVQERKISYRERQEMMKAAEDKKKAEQNIETSNKAPERDVASLIRRRIAANKRNAAKSQGLQQQDIEQVTLTTATTEPKEDITSMRSRLKKVSRENQNKISNNSVSPVPVSNHQPHDNGSSRIERKHSYTEEKSEDNRNMNTSDYPESMPPSPYQSPRKSYGSKNVERNDISIPQMSSLSKDVLNDYERQKDRKKPTYSDGKKEISNGPSSTGYNLSAGTNANKNVISTPVDISQKTSSQMSRATFSGIASSEPQPQDSDVAALFAKRSAVINPPPAPVERSDSAESNGKLLTLFAQRAGNTSLNNEGPHENKVNNHFSRELAKKENSSIGQKTTITVAPSDKNSGDQSPALKNDPKYEKYFKMLKVGMPLDVVKHSMTRDGLDPDIMDGDHNKPAGFKNEDSNVPLKNDPMYQKYFKMLKMGLPLGAVKNAMERDGVDPTVMDGDHNSPASSSTKHSSKSEPKPKDKFRRTRLHWDTLRKVRSTSVWAMVNEDPDVEQIEIDETEFAELFQAELQPNGAAIRQSIDTNGGTKRNAVKVIDPKRANNGGIILARLKMTYDEMAMAVDTIDDTVMSPGQMQGIVEYIPTKEEKQSLRKYMTSSGKDSADAFDDLCECEKFMVAMMTVRHSKEKVRALLFKLQFQQCMEDLVQETSLVKKACEELSNSVRLRKLLGIVLNIGNRLNTAGSTQKGKAGAFAIQSLLKLSHAKAFDKKTTFLHYVVLVVLRHNELLVHFKDDLPSVFKADKIYWDQCVNDLEDVENELENVRKIALYEVQRSKRAPWRRKKKGEDEDEMSQGSMTLEEEVEALRSTKIGVFTLDAIKKVSALRENVESTQVKFAHLLEYFGEEENKSIQPHELFDIIVTFSKDFDIARDQVMQKEQVKMRERKRQSIKQAPIEDNRRKAPIEDYRRREVRSKPLRLSSMQPHLGTIMNEGKKRASSSVPSPIVASEEKRGTSSIGGKPQSSSIVTSTIEKSIDSSDASPIHKKAARDSSKIQDEAQRTQTKTSNFNSKSTVKNEGNDGPLSQKYNNSNGSNLDTISDGKSHVKEEIESPVRQRINTFNRASSTDDQSQEKKEGDDLKSEDSSSGDRVRSKLVKSESSSASENMSTRSQSELMMRQRARAMRTRIQSQRNSNIVSGPKYSYSSTPEDCVSNESSIPPTFRRLAKSPSQRREAPSSSPRREAPSQSSRREAPSPSPNEGQSISELSPHSSRQRYRSRRERLGRKST